MFVNGRPLMRQGDAYAPHACVSGHAGPHDRALAGGSASVFVNGRPAGRQGDAIGCGGSAATASGDVFIGDAGISTAAGGLASTPEAACAKGLAKAAVPLSRL